MRGEILPEIPVGINCQKAEWSDNLPKLHFNIESLRPWSCYAIELKLYRSNAKHKAIMFTRGFKHSGNGEWKLADEVTLFAQGYEDPIQKNYREIYWFRILEEIVNMWDEDRLNTYNERKEKGERID